MPFRASVGHPPVIRVKKQSLSIAGSDVGLSIGSGGVLFFQDGFESGDGSAWSGTTGTTTVVNTDTTPDGTWYLRSVLAVGSNNDNGRYKEIGTAGSVGTQFRSGFVQFKSSFDTFTGSWPASDQQKMLIVQYYDPVWSSFSNSRRKFQVIVGVAADSLAQRGQYYIQLIEWNDTTGTFVQGANVFQNSTTTGPATSFNSWDTLRLEIQLDTNGNSTLGIGNGNGVLRLWCNNALILQHTNVNIVRGNSSVGCGRLLLSSTSNPSVWQGTASGQYWDRVQIASSSSFLDAMPSAPQTRITSYVPNIWFARDWRGGNAPGFGFAGTHSGEGTQWLVASVAGGYNGGNCCRLTFPQGVGQQDTGWFWSGGGSLWQAGDVLTLRFRQKFDATYRWLGAGSLQNKQIQIRNSGAGVRMILHNERPHNTTPGGLGAAYESATNDGRFGGWVMKHNIAPPITAPTVPVTFTGGPGVTPNPSVTYVAPDSNGWYHIQLQIKFASSGQSNGFFKIWVNNNTYAGPNGQNLATTLTGPIDQMDIGGFMTDGPNQNNIIYYNDLEIEHGASNLASDIRFKTNWYPG